MGKRAGRSPSSFGTRPGRRVDDLLHDKLSKLSAFLHNMNKAPTVSQALQDVAEGHLQRMKRDRAKIRADRKATRLKRRQLRAWSRRLDETAKSTGQSWHQAWAAEQQAAALLWHAQTAQPVYLPAANSGGIAAAEAKLAECASEYEQLRRTLAWRDAELAEERRKQEELKVRFESQRLELERCHGAHRQELIRQDTQHRAERAQLQRRLDAAESRRGL